jgi:cob(I)alamin adenosyltransferase
MRVQIEFASHFVLCLKSSPTPFHSHRALARWAERAGIIGNRFNGFNAFTQLVGSATYSLSSEEKGNRLKRFRGLL